MEKWEEEGGGGGREEDRVIGRVGRRDRGRGGGGDEKERAKEWGEQNYL